MKINNTRHSFTFGSGRVNLFDFIGWMLILLLSLFFIYNNALRYFDFSDPVYTPTPTGNKPFAPFLVTHVAGGVIALIVGPLQFFPVVRNKYPRIHRNVGKVYLISIIISGIAATYLAIFHNLLIKKEFIFGTGALGLALSWFVTVGMAFWAIKKRNFLQHQEWMIRSYVVTSNFIIFRLIFYGLLAIENFPYKNEIAGVTIWASWSVPLLITEVILQAKKINSGSKKPQNINSKIEMSVV